MKPILDVQRIGKRYNIAHQSGNYLSMRERIGQLFAHGKTTNEEFWALENVSFSVMPGESIGIIGRNGAGKSTLLKILSKITPPTTGKIISRGRIASLLEVGTGFHTELSGRENIFFNGSLLGMKHAEIKAKFDEIVDFSGVEKFLDTPLKHYSSGMQLRLAFAVAAFLEPEILIIDEVLAVGDAEFQKKCMGKMEDVSKSGRTILFVSHNLNAVEKLCHRGILLDRGTIKEISSTQHVLQQYQKLIGVNSSEHFTRLNSVKEPLFFNKISLRLLGTQPLLKLELSIELISNQNHNSAFIAFDVSDSSFNTFMQAIPNYSPFISDSKNSKKLIAEIELPPLVPGKYYVSAWIGPHNTITFDYLPEVVSFEVLNSPTPNRTFPHTPDHGMIVPNSRIMEIGVSELE